MDNKENEITRLAHFETSCSLYNAQLRVSKILFRIVSKRFCRQGSVINADIET